MWVWTRREEREGGGGVWRVGKRPGCVETCARLDREVHPISWEMTKLLDRRNYISKILFDLSHTSMATSMKAGIRWIHQMHPLSKSHLPLEPASLPLRENIPSVVRLVEIQRLGQPGRREHLLFLAWSITRSRSNERHVPINIVSLVTGPADSFILALPLLLPIRLSVNIVIPGISTIVIVESAHLPD